MKYFYGKGEFQLYKLEVINAAMNGGQEPFLFASWLFGKILFLFIFEDFLQHLSWTSLI